MKPSKIFSSLFFLLGAILLVVSFGGSLLCRNLTLKGQDVPQEAKAVSDRFIEALSTGDDTALEGLIYGQPELGADGDFQTEAARRIWEAFRDSIACEPAGECYREGQEIYRDVTIMALDASGVAASVSAYVQPTADTLDGDKLLLEAVEKALSAGERVSVRGRLRLLKSEEQWYVIPDKTVLSAMSGGFR